MWRVSIGAGIAHSWLGDEPRLANCMDYKSVCDLQQNDQYLRRHDRNVTFLSIDALRMPNSFAPVTGMIFL